VKAGNLIRMHLIENPPHRDLVCDLVPKHIIGYQYAQAIYWRVMLRHVGGLSLFGPSASCRYRGNFAASLGGQHLSASLSAFTYQIIADVSGSVNPSYMGLP